MNQGRDVKHAESKCRDTIRFCLSQEKKNDKLTNTGPFKMLVAGDPMKAEKKHSQPFDFENYAKLFFSANEIPQPEDKTYAYFRRWMIFFFENVFEGDDNDPNLIDKLTTQEEMSGLLNLALISLKQLIKDNGFIHIDDITKIEKDYTMMEPLAITCIVLAQFNPCGNSG
ncbi:MAG: DUF5906 domain-containing protein [Candidatus Nitrosopolaris sp.]|jgi:phage/plasmid-associated DNA primase